MRKELPKIYDPQEVEGKIYQAWTDANCFHAEPNPKKKPFSIVMPPPNVTGQLHMGHAMDATLQDILIRYKRMQGYEALWMPKTATKEEIGLYMTKTDFDNEEKESGTNEESQI